MVSPPDIKTLFEAGAHFGHRTSRWHPKMAPYIHSKRGGIHVIDLVKTQSALASALKFIEELAAEGKTILFVGTKRQAQPIVAEAAIECGMPYVNSRWLGGMLTNFETISKRVRRLGDLEKGMDSGELASKYSKLEVQRFAEEIEQLKINFEGVKNMEQLPSAVFVLDVHSESIAVREAKKLGLPVIGIVDTNTDPTTIDWPIPANDDAIKTLKLIAESMAEAIKAGKTRIPKEIKKEGS